jgi:hypothetical protein
MPYEELLDYKRYAKDKEKIDRLILDFLVEPRTYAEIGAMLRAAGIGDATTDNPLDLCYSTTGAIMRTAANSLRANGFIYDSWDLGQGKNYPRPFRLYRIAEAA